jgi:hypothetical protein
MRLRGRRTSTWGNIGGGLHTPAVDGGNGPTGKEKGRRQWWRDDRGSQAGDATKDGRGGSGGHLRPVDNDGDGRRLSEKNGRKKKPRKNKEEEEGIIVFSLEVDE